MFGSLKPESFLIYSELESGHALFQHVDPHEKQWEPGIKPKESTWKRHLEQRRKRTNAFSFIVRIFSFLLALKYTALTGFYIGGLASSA